MKFLKIRVQKVEAKENAERIAQLVNKTNQFNLTTKRYTKIQLNDMLNSSDCIFYVFKSNDILGDYGIISVVIVNILDKIPNIDTFVMSCRIMGKLVENYILNEVENDLFKKGYGTLKTEYIKTEKNVPVCEFYDKLNYSLKIKNDICKKYVINLNKKNTREFYIN